MGKQSTRERNPTAKMLALQKEKGTCKVDTHRPIFNLNGYTKENFHSLFALRTESAQQEEQLVIDEDKDSVTLDKVIYLKLKKLKNTLSKLITRQKTR